MATGIHRETRCVEQTQEVIPLISRETSFCQNASELVFGVNVFDLDFRVQINSIEQPIKSNSVGSGNMSQCRTSSFDYHLDHCFVVFKMYNKASLREDWTCEGIKTTLSKLLTSVS